MKHARYKKGFIGVIVGLLFILACLVGLYYVLFYRTDLFAPISVLPSTPVPAPATTTQKSADKNLTTYAGTVTSTFEEVSKVSFQFAYPASRFAVSASNDGKNISITEIGVGTTTDPVAHKVMVSYEGGRGYSPTDYWTDISKKTCSGCVKIDAPFSIAGASTTLSYENDKKIVHIVQGKSAEWLFIFELEKPATAAIDVLKTFSFK